MLLPLLGTRLPDHERQDDKTDPTEELCGERPVETGLKHAPMGSTRVVIDCDGLAWRVLVVHEECTLGRAWVEGRSERYAVTSKLRTTHLVAVFEDRLVSAG